jgi:phospholipase C
VHRLAPGKADVETKAGAAMTEINRRRFLQLAGGSVAATMLSDSIARAASIPANRATRSLKDMEHIVVLMQENRSFDHYFGVLRGVRGFGDPHPVTLPTGRPVWYQADGSAVTPPFRPDVGNLALVFIEDLDHSWDGTHQMFNGGDWDQWIPAKTTTSMAHMQRSDLPFHYALADAFTVCDAYHCGMLGPTDPNRYYMWTGWDGNDGRGGGPVIANDEIGYDWPTYPERLQKAGVSWKIYQDIGDGLNAAGSWGWTSDPYIGNYGDNSLLYFDKYRNAGPSNPLRELARTGTDISSGGTFFDELAADVQNGRLPSVSWVVAPEAYTEHPAWPAGYGAWYTAGVLNALTSNPDVWARTALLITFDENDGFFDHVPGPYPNVGTLEGQSTVPVTNEFFDGIAGTPGGSGGVPGPYGLGVRVPLLVVSPWSTGGWVCSETFDHTSLIRLMEARFGVKEPQITPWRRAVCGDLSSAFDFASASDTVPTLPSVASYEPDPSQPTPPSYTPTPPASGAVPVQEPGVRPSRRLGYRLKIAFAPSATQLGLQIANPGKLGIGIQARSLTVPGAPFTYTVGPGDDLQQALPNPGSYDLSLHGPNGFFRHFTGQITTQITVTEDLDVGAGAVTLTVRAPEAVATIDLADAYGAGQTLTLRNGHAKTTVATSSSGGWYDLALSASSDTAFAYQLAGRLESDGQLTSDPQLGG